MERVPNGKYTRAFREEAVKLVIEGGLTVPEAGRRLSLPPSTLNTWVKAYKSGKLREVGKNQKPLSEMDRISQRNTNKTVLLTVCICMLNFTRMAKDNPQFRKVLQ